LPRDFRSVKRRKFAFNFTSIMGIAPRWFGFVSRRLLMLLYLSRIYNVGILCALSSLVEETVPNKIIGVNQTYTCSHSFCHIYMVACILLWKSG
jgi:hypothetical protein